MINLCESYVIVLIHALKHHQILHLTGSKTYSHELCHVYLPYEVHLIS